MPLTVTATAQPCWKTHFLLFSWGHMLWLGAPYLLLNHSALDWSYTSLFQLSGWLFYSLLYLGPAWLLTNACVWLQRRSRYICTVLALSSSTALLLLLRADLGIYELYRFHINRFVLNLVFTPGGLASLGGNDASYLSAVLLGGRILLIQVLLLLASLGLSRRHVVLQQRPWALAVTTAVLCLLQGSVYGISDIQRYGPVLEQSRAFPLFQRIRFRGLARTFGYSRPEQTRYRWTAGDSSIHYPLTAIDFAQPASLPNIIVLVAESLRWDQLTPELMPNTWAFAAENQRFTRHYSSGNGTREGLFGMFYGLYGSYWEPFLHANRGPLLMDRLLALNYHFDLRTSATFTYPEFNRTLFAALPPESLLEADPRLPPWQRDAHNTDALLAMLAAHEGPQPFMSFFFLESTHASYSFPEHSAIVPGYAKELDYTSLTRRQLTRDREALLARYHNAAHWVDLQLGRIYTALAEQGLLENTIVVVTGDHGEEFMEQGSWGHNSSFVEQQTHVPLVIHWPGRKAAVQNQLSSHLDIGTTLLQALGAPADASAYSLGHNLLAPQPRNYLVISDWHSISVRTKALKYRIPYLNDGTDYWAPTGVDDAPLAEARAKALVQAASQDLLEAITNSSRFLGQ